MEPEVSFSKFLQNSHLKIYNIYIYIYIVFNFQLNEVCHQFQSQRKDSHNQMKRIRKIVQMSLHGGIPCNSLSATVATVSFVNFAVMMTSMNFQSRSCLSDRTSHSTFAKPLAACLLPLLRVSGTGPLEEIQSTPPVKTDCIVSV